MDTIKFRDRTIPKQGNREFAISDVVEIDEGIIEFSLTSEEPYERWYGTEILRHTENSVDLSRINNGSAPLLENHDPDKFIGNIIKGWVDVPSKKLRVQAKFELDNPYDQRGNKIYHRVKNGSLKTVSGGYVYLDFEEKEINRQWHLIATRWQLIEGSFTPTPADFTVGVGRSAEACQLEQPNWEELEERVIKTVTENFSQELTMAKEVTGNTLDGRLSGVNLHTRNATEVTREQDITNERERSQAIFACGTSI